jgi:hypothetical protein
MEMHLDRSPGPTGRSQWMDRCAPLFYHNGGIIGYDAELVLDEG